uniref:Uncharacterized protein n=1 Tax=Klebsiella pneumoniae TaxID=573 RepID=A0A8B0SUP3_KLEPN|nr:hypothetical protein [Klebsiella pneumoniae]
MSGLIWPCLMTLFQMLLDTEMSAFVEVTNVVLFPPVYNPMIPDDVISKYMHGVTRLWLMFWRVSFQGKIWKNLRVEFALKDSYEKLKLFLAVSGCYMS